MHFNGKKKNKKLITIARIEEKQKNFDAMIDICNRLKGEYRLDIYGDGDINEIQKLLDKIKDIPYINYCGVAKDVEAILSKYSIFIITSYYEGFGQTLIEARSQGLPIVGFNTYESFSWIVSDHYNGRGIVPFDNDSFCEAIKDVYNNYDYYSINSLSKANETTMELIDKKWENLISRLKGNSE
ncbi:glycosyltransferase [Photobacterium damselae]|uniref:glycosyltransferase n=1 Tax=Photobacterium damselae TaxID=38293 RepID=UPI0022AA6890|nr:glycosyltransferase [Photobacterium damselae]